MIFNSTTPFNRSAISPSVKSGLFCFLAFAIISCTKKGVSVTPVKDTTVVTPPIQVNFPKTTYNPSALDTTKLFNTIPVVNNMARTDLLEISGVAASRINPGILYIHDDSGNPNQVYLTNGNGDNIGTLTLTSVGNR